MVWAIVPLEFIRPVNRICGAKMKLVSIWIIFTPFQEYEVFSCSSNQVTDTRTRLPPNRIPSFEDRFRNETLMPIPRLSRKNDSKLVVPAMSVVVGRLSSGWESFTVEAPWNRVELDTHIGKSPEPGEAGQVDAFIVPLGRVGS